MIYKVARRNVPTMEGRQNKYYAVAVSAGRSTMDMVVSKIEDRCTVTRPDILAVLAALVDDIKDRLQSGQIVELGELGNLQLTVHNKGGAASAEEWTSDLIKKASIVFRPSTALKHIAETTTFSRWSQGSTTSEAGQSEGQGA